MLFWHKHNIEKSLADLPNFTPFPDEWTVEDKVLFEQGFSFHGKTFHRIQQMVSEMAETTLNIKYNMQLREAASSCIEVTTNHKEPQKSSSLLDSHWCI